MKNRKYQKSYNVKSYNVNYIDPYFKLKWMEIKFNNIVRLVETRVKMYYPVKNNLTASHTTAPSLASW